MDILVLSVVAGIVAAGGVWMITRPTLPPRRSLNKLLRRLPVAAKVDVHAKARKINKARATARKAAAEN